MFVQCIVHNIMHINYYEYYSEIHAGMLPGGNRQIKDDGFEQIPFWYLIHGERAWKKKKK